MTYILEREYICKKRAAAVSSCLLRLSIDRPTGQTHTGDVFEIIAKKIGQPADFINLLSTKTHFEPQNAPFTLKKNAGGNAKDCLSELIVIYNNQRPGRN